MEKDGAKKYFPIKASDYDEKIIKMAQEGYLPMYDIDESLINQNTKAGFDRYFEKTEEIPDFVKEMDINFDFLAKVKPILRNKIKFTQADATKKCLSVEPDNSFVMVRNFWPYLKDESVRTKFAQDLYRTLGENSAVMTGKFDETYGSFASKKLQYAGFVCNPEIYTIFEKNKIPYASYCF